nr:potassium transporter TrkG [Saccharopolyspora elongata]
MAAVIAGGLGFPALMELRRRYRMPRRWSMHTKVTLGTSVVLLAIGSVAILVAEWANPATLGPLGVPGKLLSGVFHRMTPRPSGFATLDMAEMRPESILVTDVLMFIGGAGTAPVPLGG